MAGEKSPEGVNFDGVDELTRYSCCRAATREFVRFFQGDSAGMMLPMLYLELCNHYDEARIRQRFGELTAREWLIKSEQVGLVTSYLRESVRMVETSDGLVPMLQEEEPNKSAFVRRQVETNKLLPRRRQRGPGTTSEVNMRKYLDRALRDHAAFVAGWREALLRTGTPRAAEAATFIGEYSGQSF